MRANSETGGTLSTDVLSQALCSLAFILLSMFPFIHPCRLTLLNAQALFIFYIPLIPDFYARTIASATHVRSIHNTNSSRNFVNKRFHRPVTTALARAACCLSLELSTPHYSAHSTFAGRISPTLSSNRKTAPRKPWSDSPCQRNS